MKGEENFRMENTEESERFSKDICVLLLDSDATCLANLSEMIRKCGYRVVATTRAEDLPLIINNKDKKIDLVLADFRLIEMNKYELLEKIRLICEIPVVVSDAYVKDAIVECLCRGAKLCLEKPFKENDLKLLWQFTVRRQRDFLSQIDINPPEKNDSITNNQSLGDELKKNNEVETEDLDKFKDELRQGSKRKERADKDTGEHTEKKNGSDLGDQKKLKLISADALQTKTLEAVPNIEANNERKEPTEIKKNGEGSEKKSPELVCMEEELQNWSAQPLIDLTASVENEFEDQDFLPLESDGESVGPHEIPLSPQESSNNNVGAQQQMPTHEALDEEVMQDGISLSDLEFDLQEEGQGSNKELFDKIFTDLAKELKP
ncbi:putative two-component response regulator-like APRR8 isoform X2 [Arabidopsis lyrata subsp. lyrata]|uniref:putative two-component response regulator-like APRR8 isoform X2 n=1 Tax=Arabidopsis lyrata subsp. lyrata TaxID=81972 RepID=UPI000A29AECC|nr:putative two-component response regulator-like APRR8 isoform X2 [Arabidopsis lyrata subsp. lyrata]|eukprot:XP_020877075.1 putative two-component response regulator-like APRR8 isoform X2 [Arabidopsis lyrata subsp. lyrata]